MFLRIKNLGKLETADIEINAITVIAGENNSGKSTIGKTLFCIFNSFYQIDRQIAEERLSYISNAIETVYHYATNRITRRFDVDELAESIIENKNKYLNDKTLLQHELANLLIQNDPNFEKYIEKAKLDDVAENIMNIFQIAENEILVAIFRKKLQSEFNMQINNFYHPKSISEIILKIKDSKVKIRIENNENIDIANSISLNTEVIYIDDPFAIDNLRSPNQLVYQNNSTHREHLRKCLIKGNNSSSVKEVFDEIIATKKLERVFENLNSVCPGEMVKKTGRQFAYRESGSNALVDMVNVSTGLKTFVIIKTLLLNGCLEENGTIILDEPEIHLHPEWQLIFAELIVLLQKEFNMHILLNTHSPYFLNAIEVYSYKHGIAENCKYYLAEISDTTSRINDVSDNIEKIYEKLARPLQVLENERYK